MSKILRIYAKKGPTTAQEDFLGNLERGLSRPLTPEPTDETVVDETVEEPSAVPVDDGETKPFSDPKPMEPQEDVVAQQEISPVKEPLDEQIEIPFEQPLEEYVPEPMEQVSIPTPTGGVVTEKLFRETIGILNTRIDNINLRIQSMIERIKSMALNLEALTEEVTRAKTVQASAVELINKVVTELEAVSAELAARESEPPIDTSAIDALATELKESTDTLAAAVADSVDVKPTHKVVLNSDNPDKATVEVILPEVLPEVVEATVEPLTEGVDPTSSDPQARVVVDEASAPVAEVVAATPVEVVADPDANLTTADGTEISTGVVETADGEANVAVAVDPETPVGEVVDAVKEAYDATPEVTAVPVQ